MLFLPLVRSLDELKALEEFAAEHERDLDPGRREPLPQESMFFRVLAGWCQHSPDWPIDSHLLSAPPAILSQAPV